MNNKNAIDGLRIALQTELNGIEFYRMAAEKTEDGKGREVFKMLANDEIKHFNELQIHFKSLLSSNKWAPSLSLTEATQIFKGASPIFSEELKARIKDKHFEMSALSIGALLESSSIDLYRKLKEEVEDKVAKDLFARLQKWEESHLQAITRQLDLLKEDFWAQQQFTPLY